MEFQRRITVAICIQVRVSSKKKTMSRTDIYFILSIKRVLHVDRPNNYVILTKKFYRYVSVVVLLVCICCCFTGMYLLLNLSD